MRTANSCALLAAAMLVAAASALAAEQPIGGPIARHGMTISAVYLQAVRMDAQHGDHSADMHLEADIRAAKGNANGFGENEWLPYLAVAYEVTKPGAPFRTGSRLVPMVAADGPHYGDNVKLDGPGRYRVSLRISPPAANDFRRHVDKETGVDAWWEPFTVEWDFTFVGSTGKKGAY